ncbi:TldD/PmbA family protein [Butyrivibrio sp. NC3005]|uniref:TldD/PmbA family protein n=1 Tax=Butyrivibrio sp. NC3005 TaxID=1280685 RepID=UPI0004181C72|nr:metallopeptidase TldD-related protein [Butyrivibrio sp. NC3005]
MANLQEISDKVYDYLKTKNNTKGDFSICEVERHEITMKDGKFTLFRTMFDDSFSVKVIKDNKKGTASINKCDTESIFKAIDDALLSTESGKADECFDIAPGMDEESFKYGVLTPDIDKLMERTKELSDTIAAKHPKIKLIEMFTKYVRAHVVFRNTNGTKDIEEYGFYEISLEFAGNDGETSTGIAGSWAIFDSLDKELITIGNIEKDLEDTENSLNPMSISEKFDGDIIFTPDCGAQMLRYLMMNAVSDSTLINKTSVWIDKIGQQVASPMLTISSKPSDSRIVQHEVHTADGFRSKDYTLIDKGVLKCFATSLYAANKCKVNRAENTSGSLIVEAGDTPVKDMIKSIKKGLIVGGVSCGRPGVNGELSGVAKNSFYVENGEIKGAVIETMINGNLFDMVKNIKKISKEQVCNGTMVMPYIEIGNVTISGKTSE